MSDITTIDMRPQPIEATDEATMHHDDLVMWIFIGAACLFTLGFVIGITFHIWMR